MRVERVEEVGGQGLGLTSMKERMKLIGGHLSIKTMSTGAVGQESVNPAGKEIGQYSHK